MPKTYQESDVVFAPLPTNWKFQDLTGQSHGFWTVLGYAGRSRTKATLWWCRCSCEALAVIPTNNLKFNRSTNCGCIRNLSTSARSTKHGQTRQGKSSPEYISFTGARQRCVSPTCKAYKYYGGRGIRFEFETFDQFFQSVGPRPGKEWTLDRLDVNGNYTPGNVRWATFETQARNRRKNRIIRYQGRSQCLAAWSEELGIEYHNLTNRIDKLKWPIERAFTEPVRVKHRARSKHP
jgi:hypothetical protein